MSTSKLAALFAIVLSLAAGCTSGGPTATSEKGKFTIAVVPKGTMHEFWKSIHAGANAAAKEFGVDIIWKGPYMENDLDDQIKVVESFTSQKVSGIVLAPLDAKGMRVPVSNAQKAGVPVIIIDSGLDEVPVTSFIATDNYAGGKTAGDAMVQASGRKPIKLIVLRYLEGSASTMERERGFLEAVKTSKNIAILSDNQHGGATMDSAQKVADSLIQRYRRADGSTEFDAVFCPNESTTSGMLRALQDAGLAGKVRFIGFDSSERLIEGLKGGEIDGLVVQNPFMMGYLGVKTMVDFLNGRKVKTLVDTGATYVTRENMSKPEIERLISPPRE
jgi:ribose transport system substrate-binding protein